MSENIGVKQKRNEDVRVTSTSSLEYDLIDTQSSHVMIPAPSVK